MENNMKKEMSAGQKAKMDNLVALRRLAMAMIKAQGGEDEMPMKMDKVTVAAPDKDGLKEGLDKAKDILGQANEDSEDEIEGNGLLDMLKKEPEEEESDLEPGEMDDGISAAAMLEKMRKAAKKKY